MSGTTSQGDGSGGRNMTDQKTTRDEFLRPSGMSMIVAFGNVGGGLSDDYVRNEDG